MTYNIMIKDIENSMEKFSIRYGLMETFFEVSHVFFKRITCIKQY